MIKTYIVMKKNEWKVKAVLYGTVASFIDNQKDISEFLKKAYAALKDVSADEFQKEFISKLAETIHNENDDKNK